VTLEASWTAGDGEGRDNLPRALAPAVAISLALKFGLILIAIIMHILFVDDLEMPFGYLWPRIQLNLVA